MIGVGGYSLSWDIQGGLQGEKINSNDIFCCRGGELIRGVRDFVGLLIFASFFPGLRKHPVPGGPTLGCAAGRGIFFVLPVLNRVYNSARDCSKQGI